MDNRAEIREFLAGRRAELSPEQVGLPADPGLTLTVYTAEPGSPSEEGLRLLVSWAATAGVDATDPTPTSSKDH